MGSPTAGRRRSSAVRSGLRCAAGPRRRSCSVHPARWRELFTSADELPSRDDSPRCRRSAEWTLPWCGLVPTCRPRSGPGRREAGEPRARRRWNQPRLSANNTATSRACSDSPLLVATPCRATDGRRRSGGWVVGAEPDTFTSSSEDRGPGAVPLDRNADDGEVNGSLNGGGRAPVFRSGRCVPASVGGGRQPLAACVARLDPIRTGVSTLPLRASRVVTAGV